MTEEQERIRNVARRIAQEKIQLVAAEYDATEDFPWEIMEILAGEGFFGLFIDEAYGGSGMGTMGLVLATEELSKACGGIALGFAGTALGTMPILLAGNEEQKKKYLPGVAAGKTLAGFAITEPEAGSDAGSIQATAKKDGDAYVLNGTKIFITNGGIAPLYTVIASTDPSRGSRGASAFIVEKDTPGFSFGKKYEKLGIRGSTTCELIFEDCRIPAANLLGKEGMGFLIAMRTFDRSRPGVAAQALGIAQGALDHAVAYSRQIMLDGESLSHHQFVQAKLAETATQVEATRALIYAVSRMIDAGAREISKPSAMTKLLAGDVAVSVTREICSLFGGYGVSRKYPFEKYMRDAKITQIYEGTNEIQREIVGKALIKEAASKKS